MKACVLHAIGDLRCENVPDPKRKQGEVLIKIRASGICGSDISRVFTKGTYHFPTIPGHEFSGEIIEADDFALIGMKCAVFPILPCCNCINCTSENYAQCENYNYFGSRCDGGFAELICVPKWNVVIASDSLSYEEIAMTEPCAVALHALEQSNLKAGSRVCIYGAGPIGIMIAKWAQLKGAVDITLVDIDRNKIIFAQSLGFNTEPYGSYDIVIEGTGVSSGFENAVSSVKTFGTLVLMGNPISEMSLSQKSYWEVLRKELTLKGTWNSIYGQNYNEWRTVLLFMDKLNLQPLISHRFELHECNIAFDMMNQRKEFYNKVMFMIN